MTIETINQYGEKYTLPPDFCRIGCRAIIVENGRILLSYEVNTGVYLSPGGGLEPGETFEECVIREVREETGNVVKILRPFINVNEYFYEKVYESKYFVCEVIGKDKPSLTEVEIIHGVEPEWVEIDRALEIFGSYETIADEELAAQYKREFTVLSRYLGVSK